MPMTGGGDSNQQKDIFLIIIAFLAGIITMIKGYDDLNGQLTKGQKFRKLIVGCFGSFITVFAVFEVFAYFGLPTRLCLALSAVFGYLGGDVSIKLLLGYIEKLVDKKVDKIGDK